MRDNRKGEKGAFPFRSGRFFSAGGKWFFTTRGGVDHGPYESRNEAEAELLLYLRSLTLAYQQIGA